MRGESITGLGAGTVYIGGEELSSLRPSLDDLRSAPDLRVLDGIASWCGGLHGAMPLDAALGALASGLGATSAAILRHHHRTESRPRLVALFPGAADAQLTRGYADDVLGYQFGRARPGTVWFLGDMLADEAWNASPGLDSWLKRGGPKEIAVIPMSVSRQSVDYVEFHFAEALSRGEQHDIEALVPTIERSWVGRKSGLVAEATADNGLLQARPAKDRTRIGWDQAILGMSNPAGLSRAEFRVCLLISRGLSVKAVSDELGLSENTVRSHLRAIYSKTNTSSLSELLYLILSVTEDAEPQTYGARRA